MTLCKHNVAHIVARDARDRCSTKPTAEWAHRVRIDLPTARNYAQAVHTATDAYLATLTDEDLTRVLDLTSVGFG